MSKAIDDKHINNSDNIDTIFCRVYKRENQELRVATIIYEFQRDGDDFKLMAMKRYDDNSSEEKIIHFTDMTGCISNEGIDGCCIS